jgi:hypothetical protein
VEDWSNSQTTSFIVEILQEKLKADRIDDRENNPRDCLLEYVGEYIDFKFGSNMGPKMLKTLVQALQKNVCKSKDQQHPFLYFFTRLCGVLHPQLPESATDFLCHHLLEPVLALKNTSGSNGDKRKFPLGTIEVAKADKYFDGAVKEWKCSKSVIEMLKIEFRTTSSVLRPEKIIATESFLQFVMESWEVIPKRLYNGL